MRKESSPSRVAEQFVVRFPDGMRDLIAEAAKTNSRSMNSEIVARLQQTFNDAEKETPKSLGLERMSRDYCFIHYKSLLEESRYLLALLTARGESDDATRAYAAAEAAGAKAAEKKKLAAAMEEASAVVRQMKVDLEKAREKAASTQEDLREIAPLPSFEVSSGSNSRLSRAVRVDLRATGARG
jgi:crotonobetainyl-CoA:carnitine CoA-transferase CaiB-like acyl-CoA transferase